MIRKGVGCGISAAVALAAALLLALIPGPVRAAVDEDIEKPKPEYSREGEKILARLLPRAKSGRIVIAFAVDGGRLVEVRDLDVDADRYPQVNVKDFRSGFFQLRCDNLPVGGTAAIRIASDFFSSSTRFWAFNPDRADAPWEELPATGRELPLRVQEIALQVSDGGELDADGAADGKILLQMGPRDSFWGYAIGTLFIRFFGIFIVLGVLQAGMMLSGRVFSRMAQKAATSGAATPCPLPGADAGEADEDRAGPDPETVAAIAVALHLHQTTPRAVFSDLPPGLVSPWLHQGRAEMMAGRLRAFERPRVGRK